MEIIQDLRRKTMVVTGATSGIGRAVALVLALRGCGSCLSDRVGWVLLRSHIACVCAPHTRPNPTQQDRHKD